MNSLDDWSVVEANRLSKAQLKEVRELAEACKRHDGAEVKVYWNQLRNRRGDAVSDFLCYLNDTLIGYLGLYGFDPAEAEVSGMVRPGCRGQGAFRRLVDSASGASRVRGVEKLLFICNRASASGVRFMESLGARRSFTEIAMELEESLEPQDSTETGKRRVSLVEASPLDRGDVARIDASCFGTSQEAAERILDLVTKPGYRTFLALDGAERVGKVAIASEEQRGLIFGLGVRPELRGQGYGREILAGAVGIIRAESLGAVRLEVSSDNPVALNLYRTAGFRETATFDYYELAL